LGSLPETVKSLEIGFPLQPLPYGDMLTILRLQFISVNAFSPRLVSAQMQGQKLKYIKKFRIISMTLIEGKKNYANKM